MLEIPLVHNLLLVLHILLLVYWLGGDLGVFYTSRFVTRPELPPATRAVIVRIFLFIDMAPRVCLIAMLPVGFTLAAAGFHAELPGWVLIALWLFAAAWLWLAITVFRLEGSARGHQLARIDWWVRIAVVIGLLATAIAGFLGHGPITADWWLSLKVLLFAGAICCGLMIRHVLKPFGPAFGALMQEGSTPQTEDTLNRTLARARPYVLVIWAILVINSWLGVSQGIV